MSDQQFDLGSAELEVLRTLWDAGPATVRQVMNRLHERGRHVAYTTVLTFLTRLEAKGYVASDRTGVAYVYRPVLTRERVSRSRLRSLLEQLYDGAAGQLALQLIRSERFTPQEIEEMHQLIDRLDARQARGAERGPARSAAARRGRDVGKR